MKLFLFFIFLFSMNNSTTKDEFVEFIESLEKSNGQVNDYTCKLYKKEFVDGKYTLKKNIFFKFKKPHYYYLNWTEGDDKGMEAIFAGKKYKNKLKVHPGGLMSFVNLSIDPRGKKAMNGCRHSILDSDFGSIIKLLKDNYSLALKKGGVEIHKTGKSMVDGSEAVCYKLIFPKDDSFYGYKIYIHLCKKHNLPVKFMVYDKENKLLEDYEFWDLKVNVGLTDLDFDVKNPDYEF